MDNPLNDYSNIIENYDKFQQLFQLQCAYLKRKKISFSIVFLKFSSNLETITYKHFVELIKVHLRNSDFLFEYKNEEYVVILLAMNRVPECQAFIHRLKTELTNGRIPIIASITEIANANHSLEEILQKNEIAMQDQHVLQKEPIVLQDFQKKEQDVVKVSIIENNEVSLTIFKNFFHHLVVQNIELQIQTFPDGLAFIESEWYRSAHQHVVILNDILPKKNGFEVLNYLRSLPNERKYIIFFISTRLSEDAQLYCFENGADGYWARPFNLRVFEKQLKNFLQRLN